MTEGVVRALKEIIGAHQLYVRTGETRLQWVEVGKSAGGYGVIDPRTARVLLNAGLAADEVTETNRWRIRLADQT